MQLPSKVTMVEVGPRDGLQNESKIVSVKNRLSLIEKLADAGLSKIEVGSFVSPKAIPQMTDTDKLLSLLETRRDVRYSVLTPNMQGFEAAVSAGAKEVAVFTAASETFSQKNINCSKEDSFLRFFPILKSAKKKGIAVRGYVSCVLGCPYEGEIAPTEVARLARRLFDLGVYEVSLGDTIGIGTPGMAQSLIEEVAKVVPVGKLAVHFHDTYAQGLVNIYATLEKGIRIIDSSVAGLGGCPYAKGTSGNVASEDVLYMLNGLGINSGVDQNKLALAGSYICKILGCPNRSRASIALTGKGGIFS